ncbi:MAG: hypothetical protein IKB25_08090 [Lentisphaeria bacterium]|nr:hypothetical protein [Lentisphaeria bacterium]
MKKLFLLLAALCIGQLFAAEIVWNKTNNFDGWKRFQRCKVKVENGLLTLSDIAFDCCMVNDSINANPADYNALSITYRAEGIATPSSGEVFFIHGSEKFSEKRKWGIPSLVSDGKWHTLTIAPKNLNSWLTGGNITSFRIDMVNKPGGKIEISEIKLHKLIGKTSWSGNDLNKWKSFYRCKGKISNGMIVVDITQTDCTILSSGIELDPKEANTFVMVYRAKGTPKSVGELYFARGKENFSDSRRWRLPALIADGKWQTMRVEDKALNNQRAWYQGPITKLRLDPTNAAGGTIEIKEIRFEKNSTVKPLPKTSMKPDAAPEWKPVVSQLKKKEREGAYFNAKMIKAPQDTPHGKMMRPFFVRKKIFLKDTPVHAKLQFTADDYSQIVINGHEIAYSNSWRDTVVCDAAHVLKKGYNVLGFQYYNKDTWGGVFGELYVQYPDGSSEKISTDASFKSTDKEIKNWATLQVDDSKWDAVIAQNGPPNKPWLTTLNYIDFKDLQKITKAQLSGKKFKWGDKLTLKLVCEGKKPERDITFRFVLYSKETVQWAEPITIQAKRLKKINSNSWQTGFTCELPWYIPVGNYEVKLESQQFSVTAPVRRNLKISLESNKLKNQKFALVPDFRVVRIGNTPRFQLNGKPFYMSLAKCHSYFGDQSPKISGNAPFSAVNPSPNYEKWHPRVGVYDFSEFDRLIAKVIRAYPETHIIFGLDLYVPPNFQHQFPEEMAKNENGKNAGTRAYSFYSKKAADYLAETAVKAIEYIEKSPYANRIIGYRLGGAYTTEFLGWEPGSKVDFSNCAKKGFTAFASKYYPELKDFTIPDQTKRTNIPAGTLLWNPAENLSTVAFFDSYSNANADCVVNICSKAKDYLKKQKLNKVVGTYFGYVATLNHTGLSQMRAHYALKRLLKANTVDFIMSPNSYPLRNLGDIVGDMKPFTTLNDYNIISFVEDDTRTHNTIDVMSTPGSRSQVITEQQSLNVMRRNIGVYLCRNQPENYNPMFTGAFNFKSLEQDIARRRILGDFCEEKQLKRNAEVAVVVSEKAIVSMPVLQTAAPSGYLNQYYNADGTVERTPLVKNIPNYEMYVGNQGRFMRTGAPADIVLAEALDKAKPYKVYAFLNCFNYDKKFLDTVKKLQQKKCTLLWVYAPGFAYQNKASLNAMKQLTGFQFKKAEKSLMPAVVLPDGSYSGMPTARVNPVFSVTDKDVRVLGKYEDGTVGLASRKVGNTLSYFSGPWLLGLPFLSQVMKESGVHVFSETGDPLEANDSLVVLHARNAGLKKIKLPRKADVLDVYANKIIARNTDSFEYRSALHETKLFYYGNDVETLQNKLKKLDVH